ncbi:MAG: hypothetical protein ACR2PG_02445 [Hyphomicrobiaceae bacterium]
MRDWQKPAQEARFDSISKKYPYYSDSDLVSTRVYVLYADGLSWESNEDIEERYRDITLFQALQSLIDKEYQFMQPVDEDELELVSKYVEMVKDTQFELKLRQAVMRFYRCKTEGFGIADNYEDPEISASYVHHFAENRYGIQLKSTNEYGLYSFFVTLQRMSSSGLMFAHRNPARYISRPPTRWVA